MKRAVRRLLRRHWAALLCATALWGGLAGIPFGPWGFALGI